MLSYFHATCQKSCSCWNRVHVKYLFTTRVNNTSTQQETLLNCRDRYNNKVFLAFIAHSYIHNFFCLKWLSNSLVLILQFNKNYFIMFSIFGEFFLWLSVCLSWIIAWVTLVYILVHKSLVSFMRPPYRRGRGLLLKCAFIGQHIYTSSYFVRY